MGDPKEGPSPPTWKIMVATYLGLLPSLLIVSYGIEMSSWDPPLWLKLLAETALIVPFMHYVITPFVDTALSQWLYKGIDMDQQNKMFGDSKHRMM